MVGYLDEKYRDIGWSSARLDDVLNYIPARLTALLMVIASYLIGLDGKNAFRIVRRDHANHKSPNCAWSESAAAGALHIQLGGTHNYFGKPVEKPTIGRRGSACRTRGYPPCKPFVVYKQFADDSFDCTDCHCTMR